VRLNKAPRHQDVRGTAIKAARILNSAIDVGLADFASRRKNPVTFRWSPRGGLGGEKFFAAAKIQIQISQPSNSVTALIDLSRSPKDVCV
jgi:hypothetical protein